DYAVEIDWFDSHLMEMINILRERGELENTLIIVTSDNGMQFPRGIGNCYEYGLHVPLAISWPAKVKSGRESEDLINLADFAPTILELTNTGSGEMLPMSAKSFTDILYSESSGIIDPSREAVYVGRERHSSARWMNLGYPQRAVRTQDFLYIRNFYPERWPSGAPQLLNPENPDKLDFMHGLDENGKFTGAAYWDIDPGPTKTYLIENMSDPEVAPYFNLAVGKRPSEELYNIAEDPYCLHNLAEDESHTDDLELLRNKLIDFLRSTEDPRIIGPNPDIFENYQRFYIVRPFPKPDWVK
ncbi:MAG: sulfatase-like hydrolase/transferase, partial [Bacteroidota bacterium]